MNDAASRGWQVERVSGRAAPFHARELPDPLSRTVWLFALERPALVLGSGQGVRAGDPSPFDAARVAGAGLDVVRRRSGGAAVLLEPGGVVWADVLIGRGDPLWDDDIGRAGWWVGEWWQRALGRLGVTAPAAVHRGRLVRNPLADAVCFAGVGPGELLVGGRKVVGVSQRRTRLGARFQTAALLRWEPRLLAELVGVQGQLKALGEVAVGLLELDGPAEPITVAAVERALLEELPT